jgi:RNA polymerase sigma-70 factor, ECF subfamily
MVNDNSPFDRQAYFEQHALPLRDELEKVARRYTKNFHDAEDLVAETYAKAWSSFATFQAGTNIRAWLYRIMTNTWIDSYRRAEARPREALTETFTDAQLGAAERRYAATPSAEDHNLRWMPSEALERAMRKLSTQQRAVVFYADVGQLPYKAIADITGLPLGTVMSSIHRGRHRLRAQLTRPTSGLPERRSA